MARHARRSSAAACCARSPARLREHAGELALIDAAEWRQSGGRDDERRARGGAQLDYFAGLAGEVKGETIPMGDGAVNMTLREPFGVCARIVAYNHPLMFTAAKMAAPLAAGNTVIMKPPQQAPLSAYRMMELVGDAVPPGVLNVVTGGAECGEALVAHPLIPRIALIGSVPHRTRDRARRGGPPEARDARARRQERMHHLSRRGCRQGDRRGGGRHELHVVRTVVRIDVARVRPCVDA